MKDKPDNLIRPRPIRTFEITATLTGYMPGDINDWPSNIQDAIYAALEAKSKEVQLCLAIVGSQVKKDHGDKDDGSADRWYAHVIASEVVARDSRFMSEGAYQRFLTEKRGTKH